jgi:hypothetical protein
MASYKLDVVKKFGQYQYRVYGSGKPAPEIGATVYATINEVVAAVDRELAALKFEEDDDSVNFRNVAYGDLASLKRVVRDATY